MVMPSFSQVGRTLYDPPSGVDGATPPVDPNPSPTPAGQNMGLSNVGLNTGSFYSTDSTPSVTKPATPAVPPVAPPAVPTAAVAPTPSSPVTPPATPVTPPAKPVSTQPAMPASQPATKSKASGGWLSGVTDRAKEFVQDAKDIFSNRVEAELNKTLAGLDETAKSPVFGNDILGWVKNNWGLVASAAGLLSMLFGNNTMKLMGAIATAAGGFNIYNRVNNLMSGKYDDAIKMGLDQTDAQGKPAPFSNIEAIRNAYFNNKPANAEDIQDMTQALNDFQLGVKSGFFEKARDRIINRFQSIAPNTKLNIPPMDPSIGQSWRMNFMSVAPRAVEDMFDTAKTKIMTGWNQAGKPAAPTNAPAAQQTAPVAGGQP